MIKSTPLHHTLKYHTGLQIDFNLYGMGLLRLGHVLFRHPVPTAQHTRHGWADSPVLAIPEGKPVLMLQVYSPQRMFATSAESNLCCMQGLHLQPVTQEVVSPICTVI